MKRIIALLLILCMLAACQPTPDHDAVKQKDTNVLIDTVLSEQTEQNDPALAAPPVSAQFPARFQCSDTTEARGVHVTADVPIEVLTEGYAFPLLRATHRRLTNEERLALSRRLLGVDTLYIWKQAPRTRDDVEREMQASIHAIDYMTGSKEEWMKSSDSTEEEYEQMLAMHRERIAALQKEYSTLPEGVHADPNPVWDGSLPEDKPSSVYWNVYSIVGSPDQHEIYSRQYDHIGVEESSRGRIISYIRARDEGAPVGTSDCFHAEMPDAKRIGPAEYDTPQSEGSVTAREAIGILREVLGEEAKHYEVADVWWSNNACHEGQIQGVYDKWGYLIRMTPAFSGAQMLYLYGDAYSESEDGYFRYWPYDRIEANVNSDGTLLSLNWEGALKVTETISEETPLLPYDEVRSLFVQQMNRVFSLEEHTGGTIAIDSVKLGLFRIREKNDMESGLLVPAWFFTGTFTYTEKARDALIAMGEFPEQAARQTYGSERPLLIINAIDGSIIDPYQGY